MQHHKLVLEISKWVLRLPNLFSTTSIHHKSSDGLFMRYTQSTAVVIVWHDCNIQMVHQRRVSNGISSLINFMRLRLFGCYIKIYIHQT